LIIIEAFSGVGRKLFGGPKQNFKATNTHFYGLAVASGDHQEYSFAKDVLNFNYFFYKVHFWTLKTVFLASKVHCNELP